MTQPNPITQPGASKPANRSGNPVLKQWKETGVLPEGYYLDDKKRLRKVGQEPPKRLEPPEVTPEVQLAAMRHVSFNDPTTDKSEFEKMMREWMRRKPDDFAARLVALEGELRKKAGGEEGVSEEDELNPTETDEELTRNINELLARHQRKVKA
jgi:hypothetical protein